MPIVKFGCLYVRKDNFTGLLHKQNSYSSIPLPFPLIMNAANTTRDIPTILNIARDLLCRIISGTMPVLLMTLQLLTPYRD